MAYDQESRENESERQEAGGASRVSPGKANRSQRLIGSGSGAGDQPTNEDRSSASYAFYPDWDDAAGDRDKNAARGGAGDDPFALHLPSNDQRTTSGPIISRDAPTPTQSAPLNGARQAPAASPDSAVHGDASSAAAEGHAETGHATTPSGDEGVADGGEHAATAEDGAVSHPDAPPIDAATSSEVTASNDAPSDHGATDVIGANAAQIQAQAQNEYQQAITAIGQRETLLRGTFAQQRAAIGTVAATQAALARSDAKKAGERIRGRNGIASRSIREIVDGEAVRMRQAAQHAMSRMSAADKQVRPAIQEAAANSATYAQLDLRDGAEGQLLNELRDRLMPRAVTAASSQHRDARARDIERMASTRDTNVREMRRAGQMLATQVDAQLRDVERALVGSGDALAGVIHRNARSQLSAIDAAERSAMAFFARARLDAQRILAGGTQAAAAVRTAAASASDPGAAARIATAAASVAPQLAAQRERLTGKVDGVVERAGAIVARGLVEFESECGVHRAMAHGDHAGVEAKLAGDVAGKIGQLRVEWAKETDLFTTSASSFAAAVEHTRAQLIAQLPDQFGGILRSAVLERRKSRLEGAWDALSGLVTTIGKFVAAVLVMVYAPLAFGVAALIGKAGALVDLFRDVAHSLVGMVEGIKERYKILFRSWDDWPWYGKVMGVWATTLLAIGDMVGLPSLYEGATGRELMSNRELSEGERGAKGAGGGLAAVTTFIPAKIHADTVARNAMARQMGADLAATEALAAAEPKALPEGAAAHAAIPEQQVILQGADTAVAKYAKNVNPLPDTLDVFLHGAVDDFIVVIDETTQLHLTHRELANYIKKSGKDYSRVRLISCKTGAHPQGAAQHLVNQLDGEVVIAPTERVHIAPDGSLTIGPRPEVNTGSWVEFRPKKSAFRYTKAAEPPPPNLRERLALRKQAAAEAEAAAAAKETAAPERAMSDTPAAAKTMGVDEAARSYAPSKPRVDPAAAAVDASAINSVVDGVVERAGRGVHVPTLRKHLHDQIAHLVSLTVSRVERQLADDAAEAGMSTAEREAAITEARTLAAEEGKRAVLDELDRRIAERHGDVQQLGTVADADGIAGDSLTSVTRGADSDLRALESARDAMAGVEAGSLTTPRPASRPRWRKATTRVGVKRKNRTAWRKLRDSWDEAGYGDILSDANRKRIAQGRVPIVDEAWIRYVPGDEALLGEPISIHHIKGTILEVPLPKSRHEDAHMPGGTKDNPGGPGMTGSLEDDLQEDDDGVAYA